MSIGQEHIGPNTVHTIKVGVHRNEETIPILKLDGILSYFFITDHGGTVDESKLRTQLQYHLKQILSDAFSLHLVCPSCP